MTPEQQDRLRAKITNSVSFTYEECVSVFNEIDRLNAELQGLQEASKGWLALTKLVETNSVQISRTSD
jgi:hypothetical protein